MHNAVVDFKRIVKLLSTNFKYVIIIEDKLDHILAAKNN